MAPEIRAGSVLINDFIVPTADPRLPFGGRGESGYGVTRGPEGLLEMTVPQVISVKRGKWLPHSDLPHAKDEQLLDGLLQFQHGGGWALRINGLKKLLASIRRNSN
jgi:aldehyde dehydrogenase (NAD+)